MEGMVVPLTGGRIDAKVQGLECVNGLFGFNVAAEYVQNVRRCNSKLMNMQVKGRFVVQGGEVVQVRRKVTAVIVNSFVLKSGTKG